MWPFNTIDPTLNNLAADIRASADAVRMNGGQVSIENTATPSIVWTEYGNMTFHYGGQDAAELLQEAYLILSQFGEKILAKYDLTEEDFFLYKSLMWSGDTDYQHFIGHLL